MILMLLDFPPRWRGQNVILTTANSLSKNVRIIPVIIAELELGNVQRQVLGGDLVERADYALAMTILVFDLGDAFYYSEPIGNGDRLVSRWIRCARPILQPEH